MTPWMEGIEVLGVFHTIVSLGLFWWWRLRRPRKKRRPPPEPYFKLEDEVASSAHEKAADLSKTMFEGYQKRWTHVAFPWKIYSTDKPKPYGPWGDAVEVKPGYVIRSDGVLFRKDGLRKCEDCIHFSPSLVDASDFKARFSICTRGIPEYARNVRLYTSENECGPEGRFWERK